MNNTYTPHYFLEGGGEMAKLIRAKDWSKTPLGDPQYWPLSLQTMVSVMLNNPFGMYIAWGKEYTQIYNDGYRPILGTLKHPDALGISTRETFSEIWHIIGSMFDNVMEGIPVGFPDLMLPLYRNGFLEECYFDFAYSPIRTENGDVGGVLVTVVETTDKKKAEEQLKESRDQLQFAIDATDLATWEINPITRRFTADDRLKEWHGLPSSSEFDLETGLNVVEKENREPLLQAIEAALKFSSGGKLDYQYSIKNPITKQSRVVRVKGKVNFNSNLQPVKFTGTLQNITEEVTALNKKDENERNLRLMVLQAPVAIAIMRGTDYVVEIVNAKALELWGRNESEVLNISVFDSMPELKGQGIKELLDDVRNTGNRFVTNELPVQLNRKGKLETVYVNFSYEALYDGDGKINGIMTIGIDITNQVVARKKVEESEDQYHKLIHSSPSAIGILYGEDLIITIGNDAIFEIWGKGREITGKPYFEALPELAEQGYKEVFTEVYRTGIPFNAVETPVHIVQQGEMTLKYYNFLLYAQKDSDGHINGIGIIATEVTSQAILNNKIKKSEQSVRSLIESAPFPIAVYVGNELRIEFANQSIMDVWGKGNDVVGKLFTYILPELENQKIFEQVREVLETGTAFHAKNQRVDLDINGDLIPHYFNYSFTPLFDESGIVYGVMNTAAEVTELNQTKQKVEESEKRFKDSVKQAPLGIAIFRGSNYIAEMANENYLLLIDKQENDFIGKPLFEALPEVVDVVGPLFEEIMRSGKPFYSPELSATMKRYGKMEQAYFNLVYHPLKEDNGEISGIMVVATEVTSTVQAKHLLEESEKHFKSLVMQSPIPMTIIRGKDHIIEYANAVMFKDIWRKNDESSVIGKSILDVFPELREQKYPELLDRAYTTGISHTEKESIVYVMGDDGLQKFYLDFEYKPLIDSNGSSSGIMITVNDVTDKVEARQKVEEAEERSRLAAEATDLATWEIELDTRKMIHTPRFAEIYGYESSRKLTQPEIRAQIPAEDITNIVEKAFDRAVKTGIYYFESRLIRTDGEMRWIRVQGKTILNEKNKPYKMVGTLRDITEEKKIQQVLFEREQKFRLLADSMPQHIWTSDPAGNLNYFNQSVYNYSGLAPEDIHNNLFQIVHPDDQENTNQKWMMSISTGEDFLIEHRFRRHDGEYRWQLTRAIPQKNEEGKIKMWVGTSTDIQAQKMFTHELENQVFERTKELNEKNIVLEKMNQELQSFTYISSHDLQEPLRKIQTFATIILERELENLSDSGKDKFHRMQNAAKRMQTLIQDLLVYSRTGLQEQNFEIINLKTIIEEVKDDLKEELLHKNADITYGDMCNIKVIPFQFRQLLLNLLSNALKFSKENVSPSIHIHSQINMGGEFDNDNLLKNKEYCHIIFSDNGIGFEPEFSKKIFEVFQRLHGKEAYSGTGIGLAIVKRIVENHNGDINANGELGKGATFNIYIPH